MNALRTPLRVSLQVVGYVTGVASLTAKVRRVLKQRSTMNSLARLNDRQLEDLGLCRADIAAIAAKASVALPAPKSLLGQLRAWRAQQHRRVATHRQLAGLHERMLLDIGIEPGQLRAVSGAMASPMDKLREAARFVAQPVVEFTTAQEVGALDFTVGQAANQDRTARRAA